MSEHDENRKFGDLADFLHTMGDVAKGKISFADAVKDLNEKDKAIAKEFFNKAKETFKDLMKSIKDKKRDLDMQAKYDMGSAVKVSQNGQTSYMGVKEKPKKSYFKEFIENGGRSLKNAGEVLTGEKTLGQAVKAELKAVDVSMSGSYRGYRYAKATVEGLRDIIARHRGTKKEHPQPKKEINPYDKLEPNQFSVALHTAYTNLVRIENFGPLLPEKEKDIAIAEVNKLMESAKKRYPDMQPTDKGAYFKDTKIQNTEAQLFAYMQKDCEKNSDNNLVKQEMKKYEAWRQNKDYVQGFVSEYPFNNVELYGGTITKDMKGLHGKFTAKDHLYNPLEKGQNVMSDKQLLKEKMKIAKLNLK